MKLDVNHGPIGETLDNILQLNRIAVQSYHSRSFNGNHCNKYLQQNVLTSICAHAENELRNVLDKTGCNLENPCQAITKMIEKAKHIKSNFLELNTKYRHVHEALSHCHPIGNKEAE